MNRRLKEYKTELERDTVERGLKNEKDIQLLKNQGGNGAGYLQNIYSSDPVKIGVIGHSDIYRMIVKVPSLPVSFANNSLPAIDVVTDLRHIFYDEDTEISEVNSPKITLKLDHHNRKLLLTAGMGVSGSLLVVIEYTIK